MPQPYSTVLVYSHTATDDDIFRLVDTDIWMREANIHCVTNACKYGSTTNQEATINAGDIIVFEDFNLADFFFKNSTAGSNCTIYCVGIAMSKKRMQELEIGVM